MKFLLLFFLVGCATASFYEALNNEAERLHQEFMVELEESVNLKDALGHQFIQEAEEQMKSDFSDKLREDLRQILEQINEAFREGGIVKDEMIEKFKEIREKMKNLKVDLGDKLRESLKELKEKVKEKVKDFWNKIKDMLKDKEEIPVDVQHGNVKEMFKKFKDAILSKIDKEKVKQNIHDIFGKGNEMADALLKVINEHGDKWKQKLLDLVDRYLGNKEEKRSLKELWDKIRDYFKDLGFDIKEKFAKFGEWAKNTFKKGLDKGKDKIENLKDMVNEFIDHAKDVKKDVAEEALEFFRPYKEDMGNLWNQLKDTVQEILKRKD